MKYISYKNVKYMIIILPVIVLRTSLSLGSSACRTLAKANIVQLLLQLWVLTVIRVKNVICIQIIIISRDCRAANQCDSKAEQSIDKVVHFVM